LNNIISRISNLDADGAPLSKIKEANDKMDAAGITNNKYTTLVSKDVEVQWEQYQAFLQRKKNMLEAEIAHQKLRGITPEQFKEIEDTFKQYDTDSSGSIDKKELKALLYALGEEKNNTEVNAIMTKYGDPKANAILYEGFKEFMIEILGVSDSKEDILHSFHLINKGKRIMKVDHC
jgi:hypothetical protein